MEQKSDINVQFLKSDIGAQSAWKGFSFQTLYIASRLIKDTSNYIFYPEDIEDLVIKKDDIIIEAVQIKNVTADLTLSSLASTKSSKGGEGFFKRVCSLHTNYPELNTIRVVYVNELGNELQKLIDDDKLTKESLKSKLTKKHGLTNENAEWLLSSLIFEKVSIAELQKDIDGLIKEYVPAMAAPKLAKDLLIQYISELSNTKGHTTLNDWQEKIYEIGTDISAIDGYYKEYQRSLVRLCDLTTTNNIDQLKTEFRQGISTQPAHIRHNLDLPREILINQIEETFKISNTVIVKGVSGQGKTALCYRYLMDKYPEELVFCVRSISSVGQAQNLVTALRGIAKHTKSIIIYLDINSGDFQWYLLVQELQARGVALPILVSIRDEDYNMTPIDRSKFQFETIDVSLSQNEAEDIYDQYTSSTSYMWFK